MATAIRGGGGALSDFEEAISGTKLDSIIVNNYGTNSGTMTIPAGDINKDCVMLVLYTNNQKKDWSTAYTLTYTNVKYAKKIGETGWRSHYTTTPANSSTQIWDDHAKGILYFIEKDDPDVASTIKVTGNYAKGSLYNNSEFHIYRLRNE